MIIVADPDRGFRARVAEQLDRRLPTREVASIQELEALLVELPAGLSVTLLGPGLPAPQALAAAERLQITAPEVSVILVAGQLSSETLQQALHAGVRDVLPASFTPKQLSKAVAHADQLSKQIRDRTVAPVDPGAEAAHRVITVQSSKGGVGKSFIAANLAVLLARGGSDVVLVDLDLQFGDLAIMLQIFPNRTIYDAAQDVDRLDHDALKGYLTRHKSKVSLLAAPLEPGLAETISAEAVVTMLRLLKEMFTYVIVDTPSTFSDHVLAAIDESNLLVTVTQMDVPSIKNLRLALQTLEMLGVSRERLRVVLNRADTKVGLSLGEVEKTIQTSIDVSIPSSRDVPLSVNRGSPIALEYPRSPVTAAIQKIVGLIDRSVEVPDEQPGRKLHLGRKR